MGVDDWIRGADSNRSDKESMVNVILFFLGLLMVFWGGVGVGWAMHKPNMKEAARMMAKRKALLEHADKIERWFEDV